MIPSVVACQIHETVLDYLRTTFDLADEEFERALFDLLDGDGVSSAVRTWCGVGSLA